MSLSKKVLIVDDCDHDVSLIKNALVNQHCFFEVASSMEEAHTRTIGFSPEIVILDVGIPKSSYATGYVIFDEILNYIRKFKSNNSIVLLTGHVNTDHLEQAMSAGACDYIDKNHISNRQFFELRIQEAYDLHQAITEKGDNAILMSHVAHIRAGHDVMMRRLNEATCYEEIIRKRDEYWKKKIFAFITGLIWLFFGVIKVAIERWHK